MMPSLPSATALTAGASVTIENIMSEAAATARGVGTRRMPEATSGSLLLLLRFQPVTTCPAVISPSPMPQPIAPSPTTPRFMRSPRKISRGDDDAEREQRLGPALRHRPWNTGAVRPSANGGSVDHDLDLIAGAHALPGAEAVEHAKAFDRAVGNRHATRQALDRVIGPNRDNSDVQRLCCLAFR